MQSCVNSGKLYIYGQRESKWDPYATKSKHHPSGSYDKPEDVWNSNKELIKKKAKKKTRACRGRFGSRRSRSGTTRASRIWAGGELHLEAFRFAVKGGLSCSGGLSW